MMTSFSTFRLPFSFVRGLTILALIFCFVQSYASDNHPWYPSLEAFEHYNSGQLTRISRS